MRISYLPAVPLPRHPEIEKVVTASGPLSHPPDLALWFEWAFVHLIAFAIRPLRCL
jgi:hypothetical protein